MSNLDVIGFNALDAEGNLLRVDNTTLLALVQLRLQNQLKPSQV